MKPQRVSTKIDTVLSAWTSLRPTKTFAGLSLADFQSAIQPSLHARREIAELENALAAALARRDLADAQSQAVVRRVVAGVLADPAEGDDGALYGAMGYVRRSDRATGLVRVRRAERALAATPSSAA